jgi:hypothetical protein
LEESRNYAAFGYRMVGRATGNRNQECSKLRIKNFKKIKGENNARSKFI